MSDDPKRGTYRNTKPGERIPDDYIMIPMYLTQEQNRGLSRKIKAEQAKDITPKDAGT